MERTADTPPKRQNSRVRAELGFMHLVVFSAALMALNALALDIMLPALPLIGEDLGAGSGNKRQWVITAYLLGFGVTQLAYGALADRFGRRPVLLGSVSVYVAACVAGALTDSFSTLLVWRVVQGVGAAGSRVLAVAVVRDRFAGRDMARVMSLTFIVFLAVPLFAPSLGQLVLLLGDWRLIFWGLATYGVVILAWAGYRIPETLRPEDRRPFSVGALRQAIGLVLGNRTSAGYMLALTFLSGALFGFVSSAQQVFYDAFGAPRAFPATFATIAGCMACAALLNARIVRRFGMRRISHLALSGYLVVAVAHLALSLTRGDDMWSFAILLGGAMFCFGLVGSNFGALAMEPMGHLAGTAASVQGFVTTVGGALIGAVIGQAFDGTVRPLMAGFVLTGLCALASVAFAERGLLFKSGSEAAVSA